MDVTLLGIETDTRLEQPWKLFPPMTCRPSWKVTVLRLAQFLNEKELIHDTDTGISIEAKF